MTRRVQPTDECVCGHDAEEHADPVSRTMGPCEATAAGVPCPCDGFTPR